MIRRIIHNSKDEIVGVVAFDGNRGESRVTLVTLGRNNRPSILGTYDPETGKSLRERKSLVQ